MQPSVNLPNSPPLPLVEPVPSVRQSSPKADSPSSFENQLHKASNPPAPNSAQRDAGWPGCRPDSDPRGQDTKTPPAAADRPADEVTAEAPAEETAEPAAEQKDDAETGDDGAVVTSIAAGTQQAAQASKSAEPLEKTATPTEELAEVDAKPAKQGGPKPRQPNAGPQTPPAVAGDATKIAGEQGAAVDAATAIAAATAAQVEEAGQAVLDVDASGGLKAAPPQSETQLLDSDAELHGLSAAKPMEVTSIATESAESPAEVAPIDAPPEKPRGKQQPAGVEAKASRTINPTTSRVAATQKTASPATTDDVAETVTSEGTAALANGPTPSAPEVSATGPDTSPAAPSKETQVDSPSRTEQPSDPAGRRITDVHSRTSASRTASAGSGEVDRVRFVQRVARAVETSLERGGPLRLRLSPPELGSLRLEVSLRGGVMTARLEAENATARSAIMDNLPQLRERLAQHQIRIDRFDVDLLGQSPGGLSERSSSQSEKEARPHGGPRRRATSQTTSPVDAAAATPGPSRVTNGGLNVVV